MQSHKILLQNLKRILLEQFLAHVGKNSSFANLPKESKNKCNNLILFPSRMMEEISDEDCRQYTGYKQKISGGDLGKTVNSGCSV